MKNLILSEIFIKTFGLVLTVLAAAYLIAYVVLVKYKINKLKYYAKRNTIK